MEKLLDYLLGYRDALNAIIGIVDYQAAVEKDKKENCCCKNDCDRNEPVDDSDELIVTETEQDEQNVTLEIEVPKSKADKLTKLIKKGLNE